MDNKNCYMKQRLDFFHYPTVNKIKSPQNQTAKEYNVSYNTILIK